MPGGVSLPLQTAGPVAVVGLVVLVIAVVAVWQSVVVVDAYEKRALTVLGEFRGVLDPGITVVPPFVSETHPIEMRTRRLPIAYGESSVWDAPVTAEVHVKVVDPESAFRSPGDHEEAVSELAETTVQEVLDQVDLDDALEDPTDVNVRIRERLDEQTREFGVSTESVSVQRGDPPVAVAGGTTAAR